jgi:predicted  nucleic acid-binding Zn-ribbon protein
MKEISVCPFCGSEKFEYMGDEYKPQEYHCHECDTWFGDEDVEREDLYHRISAVCSAMYASDDNPIVPKDEIHIEGIDEEAQGLSEAEKPQVYKIYQDNEAIVWIDIDHEDIELRDIVVISSLREILDWLEDELLKL